MRQLFLSLLFIPTFYFSDSVAQGDLVEASQIWVGGSDNPSFFTRCTHLAGNYITTGKAPDFIFTPEGHSGAIDNACKEMNSQGGIRCLMQIRSREVDEGEAPKFHRGSTTKGARRHAELSPDQVKSCAKIHTAFEESCVVSFTQQGLTDPRSINRCSENTQVGTAEEPPATEIIQEDNAS
jgi:hypothetical protein